MTGGSDEEGLRLGFLRSGDCVQVQEGDVFFFEIDEDQEDMSQAVEAVDKGASTVVVESEEEAVLCCEDKPLICVKDIQDAEAKLATVFYCMLAKCTKMDGEIIVFCHL